MRLAYLSLSPVGKQLVDGVLTAVLGAETYQRPAAGESITR